MADSVPAVDAPNNGPSLWQRLLDKFDATQPLGLPMNAVRGILALVIVGGTMVMQWTPITGADGQITHWSPPELVLLVSAVTAFFFTSPEANQNMRALLALMIVGGTVAFFAYFHWCPDVWIAQATGVTVLYFGQRKAAEDKANGTPVKP